ncbi:unnamed protein product [Medioppia subpectinata]|uniref:Mannosyl-oligosaccharide glucosidase n=1 Tax=Medioppia subpectinata TaxID=1979941 RepID=A0A7R9KJ28_9ACAR|nr:unnamed protein product [Medioppia subpectinata]CAG2103253.1 unnamed protein product [Medioppia subpectinata]
MNFSNKYHVFNKVFEQSFYTRKVSHNRWLSSEKDVDYGNTGGENRGKSGDNIVGQEPVVPAHSRCLSALLTRLADERVLFERVITRIRSLWISDSRRLIRAHSHCHRTQKWLKSQNTCLRLKHMKQRLAFEARISSLKKEIHLLKSKHFLKTRRGISGDQKATKKMSKKWHKSRFNGHNSMDDNSGGSEPTVGPVYDDISDDSVEVIHESIHHNNSSRDNNQLNTDCMDLNANHISANNRPNSSNANIWRPFDFQSNGRQNQSPFSDNNSMAGPPLMPSALSIHGINYSPNYSHWVPNGQQLLISTSTLTNHLSGNILVNTGPTPTATVVRPTAIRYADTTASRQLSLSPTPPQPQAPQKSAPVKRTATPDAKQRSHDCDYEGCGKSFRFRSALENHRLAHSEDRRFECQHCGKRYKQLSGLYSHESAKHAPKDRRRTYECAYCGDTFVDLRNLKIHEYNQHKCQQQQQQHQPEQLQEPEPGEVAAVTGNQVGTGGQQSDESNDGSARSNVNIPFDHHFHTEPILPYNTWGTFRALQYFGLRTASPDSPAVGLIWFNNSGADVSALQLRHWCSLDDQTIYGWKYHNFNDFGFQTIQDYSYSLDTSFVKYTQTNWRAMVAVNETTAGAVRDDSSISLIIYLSIERDTDSIRISGHNSSSLQISGHNEFIGDYSLNIIAEEVEPLLYSGQLDTDSHTVDVIKAIKDNLTPITVNGTHIYGLKSGTKPNVTRIIGFQAVVRRQTKLTIAFNANNKPANKMSAKSNDYEEDLRHKISDFEVEFEAKFGLKGKGFNAKEIAFGQSILSEMLGSIGYFSGNLSVDSPGMSAPVSYGPLTMLSAVPSRPVFPHPFLWDEGFHNLVIQRWNRSVTLHIMQSWLNLMNIDGWIPREIVIEREEIRREGTVMTQTDVNANPPSFLLTIDTLMRNKQMDAQVLKTIYPRLKAWFAWYNTTQVGERVGTYRWRGRSPDGGNHVLNPDTLTSGLDDFPRATHPTDSEYHLDLRCWIWLAADIMTRVADAVADQAMKLSYAETARLLADNRLLESQHWSEADKSFCDYGLHSTNVSLVSDGGGHYVRKVWSPPVYRHTCDQLGYVNLFPVLFAIVDPNSDKLGHVLDSMRNSSQMWTPYGLRSISKTGFYYNKFNSEWEEPYWRGPIWLNINYLALRGLRHYAQTPGPNQSKAALIYKELRNNIIANMFKEYERTGFVWEQYNDKWGTGQRSHPFVGWSGVALLIMAEHY